MIDKKIRITVSIPAYHYREMKRWAFVKGRGVATLASDILQARVEANLEQIDKMIAARANDLGLTPEELTFDIVSDGEIIVDNEEEQT